MGVNSGILAFLCTNLANGPADTQACPLRRRRVTGMITPNQVIGPAGQGVSGGELAPLLEALRSEGGLRQRAQHAVAGRGDPWPGGTEAQRA